MKNLFSKTVPLAVMALACFTTASRADVEISEFMANNTRTLADENGSYEDWIEIHNTSATPVDLEGWALTDEVLKPGKWLFPAVSLPGNGYLVVWASNKNRRVPGNQLHTNFKLDGNGEYLALVRPDTTKSTEYAPKFPPQVPDLSYGPVVEATSATPVQPGTAGKVLVPADGSLGTTWTGAAFDDTTWTAATNGIGFETGANEFGAGWTGDILADGPSAYYRLEETGVLGIAANNAVSGGFAGSYLNGVTQNVATVQSPAFAGFEAANQGARFDGTDDKVDVAYNAALNTQSFSFSFWMKWNGGIVGTHKCPLASRESSPTRGFIAYVLPTTQRLSFWTGTGGGAWDALDAPAAGGTIAANTWYHVAGTYDDATKSKKLYLNGALVGTRTVTAYSPNGLYPLRIGSGASEGAGQFWFPGDIDEVAVFNRALTAGEVTTQYTAATGGAGTGVEAALAISGQTPAGWWRLKDATTSSVVPVINQGSAGALANGAYNGSATLGLNGPRPSSEAGMPADNKAPRFAGSGYIEVPNNVALNPAVFTVECWARPTGGAGAYRSPITSRDDNPQRGYIFYAAANNNWEFWTGTGAQVGWNVISGGAVTLNTWVHLVGTFDGTIKRFYVNGVLKGESPTIVGVNTARPTRIAAGATDGPANFFFPGDVDEVAITPRALTATEVTNRYALGKNNTPPPAVNDFAGLINTNVQAQMLGINPSAYFRLPFTVSNPAAVASLVLKMKYDDGFQAWLNGVQIASGNRPNTLDWNSAASERSSNTEAVVDEVFSLNAYKSALQAGTNVLAIQGMNLNAANPDFLQVARVEMTSLGSYSGTPVYLTVPSPGGVNTGGSSTPGPAIALDTFAPAAPTTADDITVTCRVTPVFSPVASVTLNWRTAYNALQQTPMLDDGTNGDATAADGIYTAVIAKTNFTAGQMVRWYFSATDSAARTSRWPSFTDPVNSPEYLGTMITDPGFTTTLPVWYWFAQNPASGTTRGGTRGAVFFNNELHDNVFVRLRGGFTSTGSKKFDFNTGDHCLVNAKIGRVEEANLNGSGLGGIDTIIRPPVAYEIYRRAGGPSCECFPVMMRVNGALDTGSGRGGVAYFVEQVDERYLRRNGLDDKGALYKMDQRANLQPVLADTTDGVQKRTRLTETNSDLQALVDAVHVASPLDWNSAVPNTAPVFPVGFTTTRTTKMFDIVDLASVANYCAARIVAGDTDDTRKNFYFYRDTNGSGEWMMLPWDKDGTLGNSLDAAPWVGHPLQGDYLHRKSNASHQWNYLYEACFTDPKIRPMILRRLRTLMDTILGPTTPGSLETLVDSYWAPIMNTTPAIPAYAVATPASIKTFLDIRRNGPLSTSTYSGLYSVYTAADGVGAGMQIPPAQPANAAVAIGQIEFLPASGNQDQEFVEIQNPNSYDIDISGWYLKGGVDHTFEPGTVIRANDKMYLAGKSSAFRARTTGPRGGQDLFVQGSFNGTLSARGETIEIWDPVDPANLADDRLVTSGTYTPAPTPAQQALRITEIMFDPPVGGAFAAGEYEFVELMNTSASALVLTGTTFTDGITFTFPAFTLDPGARTVVVKNQAAFESRYGAGLSIAGVYTGSLDNSGERLRIVDAVGEEVLDFRYEGTWYPSTHGTTTPGGGSSLVIVDPLASYDTWGLQQNWRASSTATGSPDTADALPEAATLTTVSGSTLTLAATPGRSYRFQRSLDLGGWTDLGYSVAAPDGTLILADPAPPAARAYYRVLSH